MRTVQTFLIILTLLAAYPLTAENIVFPDDAGVIDITKPPYNADNTGTSDVTAVINLAVEENKGEIGSHYILYFPNGTYRISDTVRLDTGNDDGGNGDAIALQGQSRDGTIWKLDDGSAGFGDAGAPKPMYSTTSSSGYNNIAFQNAIFNMTFNTGSGNAGAVGVEFIANNQGSMRDVLIKSEDGNGWAGIDMETMAIPGPALIQHVEIDGFQYGVRVGSYNYHMVLEHVTLKNLTKGGIFNNQNILTLRKITAQNVSGPALINEGSDGFIVMIESDLAGSGGSAVSNNGYLLLRDVTASGYSRALTDKGVDYAGMSIDEFVSTNGKSEGPVFSPFPGAGTSTLNLPVEEAPDVPWDDTNTWVNVVDFGATPDTHWMSVNNDAEAIQAAIDSMAGDETTLYFPKGVYHIRTTHPDAKGIILRGNVRRVVGNYGAVKGTAAYGSTGQPVFTIQNNNHGIILIENLGNGSMGINDRRENSWIENESSMVVVIRNIFVPQGRVYSGANASGKTFLEDVFGGSSRYGGTAAPLPGGVPQFRFGANERVWFRQFNTEQDDLKVINDGGILWVLGLKTEDPGTVILTHNGGMTEVLGATILPSFAEESLKTDPIFVVSNAVASFTGTEHISWGKHENGAYYSNIIREVRGADVSNITRDDAPHRYEHYGRAFPLYCAYDGGDNVAPILTATTPSYLATNVSRSANIELFFNETVTAVASKDIVIRRLTNGSVFETIAATTTTVNNGTNVVINPTSDLDEDTPFYVEIDAGAFQDAAGNPCAALSGTNWRFTPADSTTPTMTHEPLDDATGVRPDTNYILSFSEYVRRGNGNITIRKSSDSSVVEEIDVRDTTRVIGEYTNVIIVNPATLLDSGAAGVSYYIEMDATCFMDYAGNAVAAISGTTAWNFTTEPVDIASGLIVHWNLDETSGDTTVVDASGEGNDGTVSSSGGSVFEPGMSGKNAMAFRYDDDTVSAGLGGTSNLGAITLAYWALVTNTNESGTIGSYATCGKFDNDNYFCTGPMLFWNNKISMRVYSNNTYQEHTADLSSGDTNYNMRWTHYVFTWDIVSGVSRIYTNGILLSEDTTDITYGVQLSTAILGKDPEWNGKKFAGLLDDVRYYSRVLTESDVRYIAATPTRMTSSPAHATTHVATNATLSLTFDDEVFTNEGTVTIYHASDDSVFEAIPIGDTARVSGQGTTTIALDPAANFVTNTTYYVIVEMACLTNNKGSGNHFRGITNTNEWAFTTVSPPIIATNTTPLPDAWVSGTVALAGYAEDAFAMKTVKPVIIFTNDTASDAYFVAANITNTSGGRVYFSNSLNTTTLPNGTNVLYYFATNTEDTGALFSNTIRVDNEAPTLVTGSTTLEANATNDTIYGVTVTGSDALSGLASVLVFISNNTSEIATNAFTTSPASYTTVAVPGLGTATPTNIAIVIVDACGNVSAETNYATISVIDSDNTPPTFAGDTNLASNTWYGGSITLEGYADDAETAVDTVVLFTNNAFYTNLSLVPSGGISTFALSNIDSASAFVDGTNTLTYYATNTGITPEGAVFTNTLLVDNNAPTFTATPTLAGTTNDVLYGLSLAGSDAYSGLDTYVLFISNTNVVVTNTYGTTTGITLSGVSSVAETYVGVFFLDTVGNVSVTNYLYVTNNIDTPPVITNFTPMSVNARSNTMELVYTIFDNEDPAMDVRFSYKTAEESTWTSIATADITGVSLDGVASNTYTATWHFGYLDKNATNMIRIEVSAVGVTNAVTNTISTSVLAPLFVRPVTLTAPKVLNNPCTDGAPVTFANIPAGSVIRVYTVSGALVKEIVVDAADADGMVAWNVMNAAGQPVAPGIYICRVAHGGVVRTVKVIIAR